MSDDACPGEGKCHGCRKWCPDCGTVAQVCDIRADRRDCPDHPMPRPGHAIRARLEAAKRRKADAHNALIEATQELYNAEQEYAVFQEVNGQWAKKESEQ